MANIQITYVRPNESGKHTLDLTTGADFYTGERLDWQDLMDAVTPDKRKEANDALGKDGYVWSIIVKEGKY